VEEAGEHYMMRAS